jgi:hypothetical protein
MPVKMNGATSGYTQLQAAAVAASNTLTLPASNGALVAQSTTTAPTNGQIPIGNGTDYTAATITAGTNITITNGAGSITIAAATQGVTLGTPVATTSGTAFDFTGIPSTAKIIWITFTAVATNGVGSFLIQLGTSGGIQTTGYLGSGSVVRSAVQTTTYTTGFGVRRDTVNQDVNGSITLTLLDSSNGTWACSGVTAQAIDFLTFETGGSKVLSGTLDRIRLTNDASNTFNAGKMNIAYI